MKENIPFFVVAPFFLGFVAWCFWEAWQLEKLWRSNQEYKNERRDSK